MSRRMHEGTGRLDPARRSDSLAAAEAARRRERLVPAVGGGGGGQAAGCTWQRVVLTDLDGGREAAARRSLRVRREA
eukprot:2142331-Alexandrium_andersonii.AAC.1